MNKNNLYKTYEDMARHRPHIRKKLTNEIPIGFAEHVRQSAISIATHFGIEEGERIIYEAYTRWPELIDDEINILINECTIDNGNSEGLEK